MKREKKTEDSGGVRVAQKMVDLWEAALLQLTDDGTTLWCIISRSQPNLK
jgi:hypothetical protein